MVHYLCILLESFLGENQNKSIRNGLLNDLIIDGLVFVEHVKNCEDCCQMIVKFSRKDNTLNDVLTKTGAEFTLALKGLWEVVQKKSWDVIITKRSFL